MANIAAADSHKISFKIIEVIKQHPVLYINDVKGIDVKLQDFRQKVWQYIADDIGLDANWMKLRWKNLRDTYCRIMKYKNKPDKGVRRKKWIYEDHLNFLTFPFEPNYQHKTCEVTEEYLQLINSNDISFEGLLEQLEDKTEDEYTEFEQIVDSKEHLTAKLLHKNTAETITIHANESNKNVIVQPIEAKFQQIRPKIEFLEENVIQDVSEPPVKKRKIKNLQTNSTCEVKMAQKNVNRAKNSLELFFDSMAKTVKKMPEDLQSDIRFKVCKAIAEAELKSKREVKKVHKTDPVHTLPKILLIPCHMIDKVK